jgi:hypothetical protein
VIFAKDHFVPGNHTGFTVDNINLSMSGESAGNRTTPVLNLVEAFEYINDRNGTLKTRTPDGSDYVYYEKPEDLFANKDPRLYGSIVYSGADFNGTPILYQAGLLIGADGSKRETSPRAQVKDDDGDLITSLDGPDRSADGNINNTGFNFRKFIDYKPVASNGGTGSDMWYPYIRIAEVYLIAAEAAMELSNNAEALTNINAVRSRAGIQELSGSITLDDIAQEKRVEFAFENHRWWDLKRWRRAHTTFTGEAGNITNNLATHVNSSATANNSSSLFCLFPYKVKIAGGSPNNGKYVFEKEDGTSYLRKSRSRFEMRHYYNFLDNDWLNRNPKLIRNPYQ